MNRSTLRTASLALALAGAASLATAQTSARNPQRPDRRVEDVRPTKDVLRDASKIDALLSFGNTVGDDQSSLRKAPIHIICMGR